MVVDPTNEDHLFGCSPSGFPAGQSFFFQTWDAGATWSAVNTVTEPTDARSVTPGGGDCDVAIDASGAMYSADDWIGDVAVGASKDGGRTWTSSNPAAGLVPLSDRPWLVGGTAGTVYLAYHAAAGLAPPGVVWFTSSSDYGATFAPVSSVEDPTTQHRSWDGNLVAAPGGQDFYMVLAPNDWPGGNYRVVVAASHDGGHSWSSSQVTQGDYFISNLIPTIALDAAGGLHVAWIQLEGSSYPVYYSTSTDQGRSWTAPLKVWSGGTAIGSWIAAGAAGHAVVAWWGTPDGLLPANGTWSIYYADLQDGILQTAGPTTPFPLYVGPTRAFPEFEAVRIDKHGKTNIAASIWTHDDAYQFQVVFQRQL